MRMIALMVLIASGCAWADVVGTCKAGRDCKVSSITATKAGSTTGNPSAVNLRTNARLTFNYPTNTFQVWHDSTTGRITLQGGVRINSSIGLTLTSTVNGSNAISFDTAGARFDLGPGTLDYFDSDGTIIRIGSGNGSLYASDFLGIRLKDVGTSERFTFVNGDGNVITSEEPNGSTAIGLTIINSTSLSTTGAKLVSIQNASTEKSYIDKDGNYCKSGAGCAAYETFNKGEITYDFSIITANTCADSFSTPVDGAATGDLCMGVASQGGALPTGLTYSCYVPDNNSVNVRACCNNGPSDCILSEMTYNFVVMTY